MDIGHLKKTLPLELPWGGTAMQASASGFREQYCPRTFPRSFRQASATRTRKASRQGIISAKESFPALGGHGKTGKPPGEPATMGSHRAFDMKPPGLEEWKATRQPPGLEKWIGTCLGWNRSKLFPGHWKFPCWDPAAQLLVACCLVLNPTPAFYGVQSAWSVGCWLWKARMALVAALVLWLLPWGQIPRSWRSWSRLVPEQTSNYPST